MLYAVFSLCDLFVAGATVHSFVTTVIIIVLNVAMMSKLVMSHTKRKQLAHDLQPKKKNSEIRKITAMLASVSIAFVILNVPTSIMHVYCLAVYHENYITITQPTIVQVRTILQIFEQLNHCINFFLYVAFSSVFRHEFLRLITRSKLDNTRTSLDNSENKSKSNTCKNFTQSVASSRPINK